MADSHVCSWQERLNRSRPATRTARDGDPGIFFPALLIYIGAPTGYTMIEPGRYRHYKGNDYEVIGEAQHSETEEPFVVYRTLYGERGLWIRPRAMFLDTVMIDGRPQPRFRRLKDYHERSCKGPPATAARSSARRSRPGRSVHGRPRAHSR